MSRSRRPAGGEVRSTARSAALNAALLSGKRGINLDEALELVCSREEIAERDRRLAEEIAYGTVRYRASLDLVIAAVSNLPLERIQAAVLEVLRGAVYQTFYLTRIPDHAAVDEAVRLARAFAGQRSVGFTNGVLRSALRMRAGRAGSPLPAGMRRAALSFRSGEHVRLDRDLLPDPEADVVAWMAAHYSYPRWLVERLRAEHGEIAAEKVLRWGNEIPHLGVRVNPLRADPDALAGLPAEELCRPGAIFSGCSGAMRVDPPGAYVIAVSRGAPSVPGLKRGLLTVQDPAQQRAVRALSPRPGERVLDLCAAPGGKTTQIAESCSDRCWITACDADEARLRLVEEAASRLGIASVRTRHVQVPPLPEDLTGAFDAVLADVPCSNTGAMNRRVESRWRASPEALAGLAARQGGILEAALKAAAPGGRVVYSTCSLLAGENGEVVRAVLGRRGGWRLSAEETVLPAEGRNDGGYWALLEA